MYLLKYLFSFIFQMILSRQGKHAEALALSELARSRALTDLIRDKLIRTSGVQKVYIPKKVYIPWIYTLDFNWR